AAYLYPLPGEAVFTDYSLWQGDQELRGEMMDAGQARSIYELIVRRRRDPALIELAGHGLVRARVFPIAPGETRKITLRYTQVLDRVGDAWRFRYPSGPVTAPRSFRFATDSGTAFGDPYSPTHQVRSTLRVGDRFRLVAFSSGVRRYRAEWTALTPESRRDAESWVRGLEAEGGTNIAGALDEAFSQPPADGALGVVVFLTDGLPT